MNHRLVSSFLFLLLIFCTPCLTQPISNRILLIIGDQWKDPESFFITDDSDFKRVVVLLKSWCLPFDVVRLDQQKLDIYHFVNHENQPRYGCIIWLVPPFLNDKYVNVNILRNAVIHYGINLIVLGDRARHREIKSLLGISWLGDTISSDSVSLQNTHFITSTTNKLPLSEKQIAPERIAMVKPMNSQVLARRGKLPILTLRTLASGTHTVWLWIDSQNGLNKQFQRTWLRRALSFTIGFMIFKNWKDHVLLRMDDPGTAQNAWLKRWSYPTLTAPQIYQRILKPLQKNNAILTIFVSPGFVNDSTRTVEPSWQRCFIDAFGKLQDYRSTKQGLDEGVKSGVLEIQCHGWTHMLPDLESEPGPWWGSPLEEQRAEEEWYREFHDGLREQDIPAAVQLRRMRISRSWIHHQFGQTPSAFIPPGWGVSLSSHTNTWCLAARAGFGWMDGYLGNDLAVRGWYFMGSEDVPNFVPIPPNGHDFGLTDQPDALDEYLKNNRGFKYIGYSDLIAYTHADIEAFFDDSLYVDLNYSDSLCKSFQDNELEWTLELTPEFQEQFKGPQVLLTISGQKTKIPLAEEITITTPIINDIIRISFRKIIQ